jgi:hypothetical protein
VTQAVREEGPELRLDISPEPTDEDRLAIAAVFAVTDLAGDTSVAEASTWAPGQSRWARAGRLAAVEAFSGSREKARRWRP